jgi:hypothetical protein
VQQDLVARYGSQTARSDRADDCHGVVKAALCAQEQVHQPASPDEGFAELRYLGINSAGHAVFRRTDVDIGASAPPATLGALPPDAVQFALEPTLGRTITIQDHGVEILQFNRAGVQYRVW